MRLDIFLKQSRIVNRRSLAREFCNAGLVTVNGADARPAKDVKEGDEIAITRRGRRTTFQVREIPKKKQVSKDEASTLFSIVSEEAIDTI